MPSATRLSLSSKNPCYDRRKEIHGFAPLLRNRFAFIVCNRQLPKNSAVNNGAVKISKRNRIVNTDYTSLNAAKATCVKKNATLLRRIHFSDNQRAILPGSIVALCDLFCYLRLIPYSTIN